MNPEKFVHSVGLKMSSAYYNCYIHSNAPQNVLTLEANTMNLIRLLLWEQSDQDHIKLFTIYAIKSREREQTTNVMQEWRGKFGIDQRQPHIN